MKILLTHRFFWPDTAPYALMLRSIGQALADDGHEVHVFASVESYRASAKKTEKQREEDHLSVRRVWVFQNEKSNPLKRAANLIIYSLALFVHILRVRPDVVTASTFPPVFAAWSASLAAKLIGARFIYHMQDIHPEVSEISNGALGRGLIGRVFRFMDNQTLRRSSAVVVLSEDMSETLMRRGLEDLPVHVINNFSLSDHEKSHASPPQDLCKRDGKRRVIFAGNMGRFQNLDVLVEGVVSVLRRRPDLELLLLGDGVMTETLKQKWGTNDQVIFHDFLPFPEARELIRESDVGLVSLTPGLFQVAYPSKIFSYLSLDVPLLCLAEPESNLAELLSEAGVAVVPKGNSPEHISAALEEVLDHTPPPGAVSDWYEQNASGDVVFLKWKNLFSSLSKT